MSIINHQNNLFFTSYLSTHLIKGLKSQFRYYFLVRDYKYPLHKILLCELLGLLNIKKKYLNI